MERAAFRGRAIKWLVLLCSLVPLNALAVSEDLNRIQREIKRLEGDREVAKNRQILLMGELRLAEKQIGKVTGQLHSLTQKLTKKRDKLRLLRPKFEQQIRAVAREQGALARQLRSGFVMGRQHRLKILLNQQDPHLLNRMMGYYGYISKARIERIASLRGKMFELEKTENEIAQGEDQLIELQKISERERARLEQARNSRQELVSQLNHKIRSKEQRLEGLHERRTRLERLVNRLASGSSAKSSRQPSATIATSRSGGRVGIIERTPPKITAQTKTYRSIAKAASTSFAKGRGRMKWPLRGIIGSRYGSKNEAGLASDGVLIQSATGSKVQAIHSGRVTFAEWMRGLGLLLIIDHGDGYMSLYGYNQTLLKKVGDRVSTGDVVSLVGKSGGRSEAGLYFAIRKKGAPVDPAKWCKRSDGKRVG